MARALCLLAAGAVVCPAYAQDADFCDADDPCAVSWHFLTDASRHARVDDRGGLGEGYSFSIDYDEADGNSEDFCPHCRLSVLVSDPGIDLVELERVGIERADLTDAQSTLTSLQTAASADPTGLAMMLNEGIMGAELEAAVNEIVAIQAHLVTIISALEAFERAQAGMFDWSGSFDDVIEALSLRMDTAFRGDFSSPNDPRLWNSGVQVYGASDFVDALPASFDSVREDIRSALNALGGGGLEISGNDGNPVEPASFHGINTDLTIHQRTYAANGASAYLIVYTIVNDTTRVFPMVQASMMADFDIPPLSYDTATQFDAASQAVMLYDTIPYTDPEEHYWFGLAPAAIAAGPSPGSFVFTNWNIDKNYTLAQWGSSTTQENRFRFFMWDPALSGDHDDAVGKSEKQGAISMLLTGPLLPGDQRTVAFCYAAGEGTSSGGAQTAFTAAMTACRAIYTGLTPNCGDGVLQMGEECEPAGTPTCSPACQDLVCGDGRQFAPEECDDENTTDGDGCSAACQLEVCGNGILQANEECDDGNLLNSDGCTTECTVARCGDGHLRAGTPCTGTDCGCEGFESCFTGTLRVQDFTASRSRFAPLRGVPIAYTIGFDAVSTDTTTLATERGIRVTTGPVHVEMSGAMLASEIARALDGATWTIDVLAAARSTSSPFRTTELRGTLRDGTVVAFDIAVPASSRGVSFSVSRVTGLPVLNTVRITAGTGELSVVPARGLPTDVASGPLTGQIRASPMGGTAGEECDDGNSSDYDACTNACIPAECGDGILQESQGEECDSEESWCVGCMRMETMGMCGNGIVEANNGEECDGGMDCSATCRLLTCGDGQLREGVEECDDGANGDGDGCTDSCVLEVCGDAIVQPNEECDTGAGVGDTTDCTSACVNAVCGDGLVHAGVEECDDANTESADGCSAECGDEVCGDGLPGPDEECDDGNTIEADGCAPDCRHEYCADGRPGPNEQCDDGNAVDGDGCDKDCLLENLEDCGDMNVGAGEQCDDGNGAAGDGCDEFCQLENPAACGDGAVDPGEQCDDGNAEGGDGCTARCSEERCGDGVQAQGEGCDDGDDEDGDGCNRDCILEPSECGNGLQEYGEQCDDGNADDADECTAECLVTDPQPFYETCGDGDQDFGEECDDGGREDGNGCDGTCQLEATVCGNGRLERGERCDLGDAIDGDGCSAVCQIEGEEPPVIEEGGCGGCAVPRSRQTPWALLALALVLYLRRRR